MSSGSRTLTSKSTAALLVVAATIGLSACGEHHSSAADGGEDPSRDGSLPLDAEPLPTVEACLANTGARLAQLSPGIELHRSSDPPSVEVAAIHGDLPHAAVRVREQPSGRAHDYVFLLAGTARPRPLVSRSVDEPTPAGRVFGTSWGYVRVLVRHDTCTFSALDDSLVDTGSLVRCSPYGDTPLVQYGHHTRDSIQLRVGSTFSVWDVSTRTASEHHRLTVPELGNGDGLATTASWIGASVLEGRVTALRVPLDGEIESAPIEVPSRSVSAWTVAQGESALLLISTDTGLFTSTLDDEGGPTRVREVGGSVMSSIARAIIEDSDLFFSIPEGAVAALSNGLLIIPTEVGRSARLLPVHDDQRLVLADFRPGSAFGMVIVHARDSLTGEHLLILHTTTCHP